MKYLLVEDNDSHAYIISRTLERNDTQCTVDCVSDGDAAMTYLQAALDAGQPTHEPPDLILLDLKLPGLSGHEVLSRIKQDRDLRRTPVIMLTTSDAEYDRRLAYENHANAYLVKPDDFDGFRQMVKVMHEFWGKWSRSAPATDSEP